MRRHGQGRAQWVGGGGGELEGEMGAMFAVGRKSNTQQIWGKQTFSWQNWLINLYLDDSARFNTRKEAKAIAIKNSRQMKSPYVWLSDPAKILKNSTKSPRKILQKNPRNGIKSWKKNPEKSW